MKSQTLKRFGGKAYQASWLWSHAPAHIIYGEPYFGAGAMLFARPSRFAACSEFANDIDYELTNFWNVMRSPITFPQFQRQMQATPLSSVEWEKSREPAPILSRWGEDIDAACRFFVRYRQSRQAIGEDFVTPTSRLRRNMNEQVSAWLSAVDGLFETHQRLIRVEIRNQTAISFMRELDSPHTFHYLDPPYLKETRNKSSTEIYQHEMTYEQHEELLLFLPTLKAKWMLSCYPSPLYDSHAKANGWHHEDLQIDNKSSGAKTKEKKTERIYLNYNPLFE